MRNLFSFYCGLELSEAETFGLGSGIDFVLIETDAYEPGVFLLGRGPSMEIDAASALGVDYREQVTPDDSEAWEQVRSEVLAGRPTMLSGDAFYLDYRDFRVHFPAHRFVLVGFDDDARLAFVADRLDPEPQPCSYEALTNSRNPPDFFSTRNLWGRFWSVDATRSLEEAHAMALAKSARRMLGKDPSRAGLREDGTAGQPFEVATGLAGMRRLLRKLPSWTERENVSHLALYASLCIEKFGTGGGNFRAMYAEFLHRARAAVPDLVSEAMPGLAERSAERWTALSNGLASLAKRGSQAPAELTDRCCDALSEIIELETRLFESLDACLGE